MHEIRTRIYNDLCKHLDKMENELMPDISLSLPMDNRIDFGDVTLLRSITKTVTAVNTGQVDEA